MYPSIQFCFLYINIMYLLICVINIMVHRVCMEISLLLKKCIFQVPYAPFLPYAL